MAIEISLKKSTVNPTSGSGLTLGEPVFNHSNNTFWMGKGSGNTPVWVGAGVCGASAGINAGLTYQIPTLGAVKDYFSAVSSGFLGTTASYVSTFNGLTGAIGITAGTNITITQSGNTFTIASSGGDVSSVSGSGNGILVSPTTGAVVVSNTGVHSFNGLTGAIQGVSSWNGQTGAISFVNYITSFNGLTGAVQGVSSAAAGTGISISAATGAVTITNIGVQSFNGLTGAVTGVTVGGTNTFTALNSFNSGISSAGGTFSSLTIFTAGISSAGGTFSANTVFSSGLQTDSVLSTTGGVGGTLYLNSSANGDGAYSITYIGDWGGAGNGTAITVDDQSGLITLNPSISTTNIATGTVVATGSVVIGAAAALIDTTSTALVTTAANQIIASVEVYDGGGLADINRSVEFFVQASHSSGYEALKIIAIHDGTNTYNTQYGLIRSGSSLCSSYTTTIATVAGGSKVLRLRATPINTNTTFKVVETVIPV